MSDPTNFYALPADLPVPVDDGAADHLPGARIPALALPATSGGAVNLAEAAAGRAVFYCYPRTGRPDEPLPTGWDAIPGARGCTPEACGFRDHYAELTALGAQVFGISTQTTADQQEFAARVHLPFPLLSDADLRLVRALRLPTFTVDGLTLHRRLTLIAEAGTIVKVFYPVFPPDHHAAEVVAWLASREA
ncbi:MAG TPA: peroxiredoxin [Chloroflexota bacterium]|jgi:peroxiredoxin